jgi:hypothetical protein
MVTGLIRSHVHGKRFSSFGLMQPKFIIAPNTLTLLKTPLLVAHHAFCFASLLAGNARMDLSESHSS